MIWAGCPSASTGTIASLRCRRLGLAGRHQRLEVGEPYLPARDAEVPGRYLVDEYPGRGAGRGAVPFAFHDSVGHQRDHARLLRVVELAFVNGDGAEGHGNSLLEVVLYNPF